MHFVVYSVTYFSLLYRGTKNKDAGAQVFFAKESLTTTYERKLSLNIYIKYHIIDCKIAYSKFTCRAVNYKIIKIKGNQLSSYLTIAFYSFDHSTLLIFDFKLGLAIITLRLYIWKIRHISV